MPESGPTPNRSPVPDRSLVPESGATRATGPFLADPAIVHSPDGTPIAIFQVTPPAGVAASGVPLLLVHGATADHTTWRAVGPRFAATRPVFALDRRGRGGSGDGPAYAIEREYEDVAAAAAALAGLAGAERVDVAGHSYGGRCALGASLRSHAIRRVVVYEGAPVPAGMSYRPPGLVEAVRAALERGDGDAALTTFLAGIVGMSEAALEAYRLDPVWPARVAAAHTILREIEAETAAAAAIEAFAGLPTPVLLVLGSISRSPFRVGTEALAAVLPHADVVTIAGAAHAAHHTHAEEFVRVVSAFLDRKA